MRDFISAGSTSEGTDNLPDLGLFPYQDEIRRRALNARGAHLLWGQRAGKNHTLLAICSDRAARSSRPLDIVVVSSMSALHVEVWLNIFTTVSLRKGYQSTANIWPTTPRCTIFRASDFLESDVVADIVLLDEVDWNWSISAEQLLSKAGTTAPFVCSASSPSSRDSSYMQYMRRIANFPFLVADHASTWEVNPLFPRSLLPEEELGEDVFARDFAAYKDFT